MAEKCQYTKMNNQLDTEAVFFDFLTNVHQLVSRLTVAQGSRLMPVTTDFSPCLRCMDTELQEPQVFRCRHTADCEAHDDSCTCRQFTRPALTHSRSGAVLHLEWAEQNGGRFNMDVDLVPILPTVSPYNGDISPVMEYLRRERPVGWVEELAKTGVERMGDAACLPHLIGAEQWHVNMRLVNRHTVMPRQVTRWIRAKILNIPSPRAFRLSMTRH